MMHVSLLKALFGIGAVLLRSIEATLKTTQKTPQNNTYTQLHKNTTTIWFFMLL